MGALVLLAVVLAPVMVVVGFLGPRRAIQAMHNGLTRVARALDRVGREP